MKEYKKPEIILEVVSIEDVIAASYTDESIKDLNIKNLDIKDLWS